MSIYMYVDIPEFPLVRGTLCGMAGLGVSPIQNMYYQKKHSNKWAFGEQAVSPPMPYIQSRG